MKVLHIITGLGVGGAEMQLRQVMQHSRHEPEVITLYNPGPIADMIRSDGFAVHDLGMTKNTEISALGRLTKLIRSGRYDVVHTHLYRSQVYGRIAARLARVPVVLTTEHSIGETHLERRPMTRGVQSLYLATDRLGDAVISVSDVVTERLVQWGVPARKITLIPNGVDFTRVEFDADARAKIRAEFGLDQSAYLVGVLGRLDPNKRFDLVIEAIAPLLNDDVRLMVVGKGEHGEHLERVAREQGVYDRIVFTGERHDVGPLLSTMDLFVASSAQETFGLSVLEALASGCPALFTTCPALDGVQTDRARQVPGTVAGMRAELAEEIGTGVRPRVDVPAIRDLYGVEAVSSRIDSLYERLREGKR